MFVACFSGGGRLCVEHQWLRAQIKMASQEQSVREFVAVTGVDEERARFFLESAGWSLHVRLFLSFLTVLNWRVGGEITN